MTPLVITKEVLDQIDALIELAEANPVSMVGLLERLEQPALKRTHLAQMTRQTITIPMGFFVTYSIEHDHPCGHCRHLSMSVGRRGRIPVGVGVWMVATEFGFTGSLANCTVWKEELSDGRVAINVVQPLNCSGAAPPDDRV